MTFNRSEFLSTFHDEAKDRLQKLNDGLLALEKNPKNKSIIEKMFREAHTLKGASRMMRFHEIEAVSHYIEDIFSSIHNKKIALDQELCTLLFQALDMVSIILEQVVSAGKVTLPWEQMFADLKQAFEGWDSGEKSLKKEPLKKQSDDSIEKKNIVSQSLSFIKPQVLESIPETKSSTDTKSQVLTELFKTLQSKEKAWDSLELEEYIKVPVTKINKLLNLIGELATNKINSTQKINSLRRFIKISYAAQIKLQENVDVILNNTVIQQIAMFKNLKMSLSDLTQDMVELCKESTVLYKDISTEMFQIDLIVDELQLRMKQVRLIPVGNIFEAMPRLVRDIAVAQGKKINLVISGEEIELDKKVLESIKESLIHLLRNSVDHGIELPEEREKIGKNTTGTIMLCAYHKGDNVIIEVEDDGYGMCLEKIKETAILKGLTTSQEIKTLSEQEVLKFIFYSGFSTSPIVTDISGRGIGLNVVKTDIENLKGSITVKTEAGKGTLFAITFVHGVHY